MPTKRLPFVEWLLCLITLGLYVFVWIHRMTRDVKRLAPTWAPRARSRMYLMLSMLVFHAAAVSWLMLPGRFDSTPSWLFPIGLLNAFVLTVFLLVTIVQLARQVANLQRTRRADRMCSPGLAGLLYFFWMLAVPYTQSHLNSLLTDSVVVPSRGT